MNSIDRLGSTTGIARSGLQLTTIAWGMSAVMIGRAIQLTFGTYDPRALAWVGGALAVSLFSLAKCQLPKTPVDSSSILTAILVLGCIVNIYVHLRYIPYGIHNYTAIVIIKSSVAVASILMLGLLWADARYLHVIGILVILCWMIPAFLTIAMVSPHIDVIAVHQESLSSILRGVNPYGITLPVIYNDTESQRYLSSADIRDGHLQYGYPYPPISLMLALPGHVIGGDYRFGAVIAIALAAWFMANAIPTKLALLTTFLFLFTPMAFYVLAMGWTEPFVIVCLGGCVYCIARRSSLLPYAFGLFIGVKQYLAIACLSALLVIKPLSIRSVFMFAIKGLLALLLTIVPFVAWDHAALVNSLVRGFIVRPDSLSFNSLFVRHGVIVPGFVLLVPTMLSAIAVALRAPRTVGGFAGSIGIIYLALFSFAQVSFCNYYYFILAAFCFATAASSSCCMESNAVLDGECGQSY